MGKLSDIKTFYGQQVEDYLEMWGKLLDIRNINVKWGRFGNRGKLWVYSRNLENIIEFTRKYGNL